MRDWSWLPRDEDGNPIFHDEIVFFEWMKDQICKEPERTGSPSAVPMAWRDWLAWVGVAVVVAIVTLIYLRGK